jgi:ribosomal peptide maturation radical SAM protein 1
VRDLDALPTPIYDEYFDRAQRLQLTGHAFYLPTLPFESSRGCWWGQKHHCTFCGLNGLGMAYRAKQPARALRELNELARRHRVTEFAVVDNILDMKYVHEFFSEIEQNRNDYTFFYEVKANLTREQLRLLRNGGVRRIQPGIESLSSEVLQLMNKGCTMLQNVRFLKWALYYRLHVSWNLLWRFPGEREEYYVKELEVLRKISHLQPPNGCGGIWLERFSPYFASQDAYPIRDIRPEASYYHVYPRDVQVEKVAYFFDYSMGDTLPDDVHVETQRLVGEWQERWKSHQMHTMQFRRTPDCLFVDVDCGPERRGTYSFEGALAALYEYCSETFRSVAQATEHLHGLPEGKDASEEDVAWALEEFCRRDLMVGEDGKYLSLALPAYGSL